MFTERTARRRNSTPSRGWIARWTSSISATEASCRRCCAGWRGSKESRRPHPQPPLPAGRGGTGLAIGKAPRKHPREAARMDYLLWSHTTSSWVVGIGRGPHDVLDIVADTTVRARQATGAAGKPVWPAHASASLLAHRAATRRTGGVYRGSMGVRMLSLSSSAAAASRHRSSR